MDSPFLQARTQSNLWPDVECSLDSLGRSLSGDEEAGFRGRLTQRDAIETLPTSGIFGSNALPDCAASGSNGERQNRKKQY